MSREHNLWVFQDTERLVKENSELRVAVKHSTEHQVLIPEYMRVEDYYPEAGVNLNQYDNPANVVISKKRSYEAAANYAGGNVCVHNFASATNPGGGVTKGSSAQEECLCRCSTLYFNLNTNAMWQGFYSPHRDEQNPIHNDDCIYTPDVVVFKSDTEEPKLLPQNDWFKVNVITCAAPNLRIKPSNVMNSGDGNRRAKISDRELFDIHVKRLSRIMDIALANGNDVIVLGAFGCGAFENNPEVVASAAKSVVDKYRNSFITIEFAVYCSPRDEQNYRVFKQVLGKEVI